MREATNDDQMMRRFILDQLNALERERIEEQFMTDRVFNEKLLISEEDLIEDYLDNSLDDEDRERFESVFLASREQSRKLTVARLIRNYAANQSLSDHTTSETTTKVWQHKENNVAPEGRRSWVKLLIAAGIFIAVFAFLWLLNRDSSTRQTVDLKHAALEKDLADLNSGSRSALPLPPGQSQSVVLAPLNTRSSGLASFSRAGVSVIELWLLPTTLNYQNFKASIKKDGASEKFDIFSLTLSDRPQGRAVRLRIPVDLVDPATYQVELQAVTANGEPVSVGEYHFQVTQ